MSIIKSIFIGVLAALPLASTYGEDIGERIEYDNLSGNYIVWYEHMGIIEHTIIVPPTKFLSHVTYDVKLINDAPVYTYFLRNDKTSEQLIESINIDVIAMRFITDELPENWKFMETSDASNSDLTHAGFIYWGDEEVGGLTQGETISFKISANSLPGVGAVRMRGSTPIIRYVGEGVGPELEEELNGIIQGDRSYVINYAVVPHIPLSTPFVTSKLLMDMKSHIQNLYDRQLIDAALNNMLAGYLQSAADASARDNIDGLMKNLGMIESTVMSYDNQGKNTSSSGNDVIEALRKAVSFNLNYIRSYESRRE